MPGSCVFLLDVVHAILLDEFMLAMGEERRRAREAVFAQVSETDLACSWMMRIDVDDTKPLKARSGGSQVARE